MAVDSEWNRAEGAGRHLAGGAHHFRLFPHTTQILKANPNRLKDSYWPESFISSVCSVQNRLCSQTSPHLGLICFDPPPAPTWPNQFLPSLDNLHLVLTPPSLRSRLVSFWLIWLCSNWTLHLILCSFWRFLEGSFIRQRIEEMQLPAWLTCLNSSIQDEQTAQDGASPSCNGISQQADGAAVVKRTVPVWNTRMLRRCVVAPGEMRPRDQASSCWVRCTGQSLILRQESNERRAEPWYSYRGAGQLSRLVEEELRMGTDARNLGYRWEQVQGPHFQNADTTRGKFQL